MLGQAQFRATALEQVAAEHGLEGLDVVADCPLGQCQLLRRTGKGAITRGHLESTQGVQSLNPFRHGDVRSMSKTNSRS
ncbi:hypothetical protein D3C80_1584600 [compost metagenome]